MALFAWKTVQVAAITSGGPTQDITISGIGTPIAVVIEASRVLTVGTGVDHGILSFGASDGTTHLVGSVRHRDAQSTSDTGRMAWGAGLVLIMNPTANTVDGQAEFDSFITDGVRINWVDFPASAYILTVTLIYGTLAQATVVNAITSGVEDDIEPISGLGYDPTIALFWWWKLGFADPKASANSAFLHHGWAVNNEGTVQQLTVGLSERDALLFGYGWGFSARDDAVLQDITQSGNGSVTLGTRLQVEDFFTGSGGVNVKTVNGTVSFNCLVLFLNTGKNRVTSSLSSFDSDNIGSSGSTKKITASSASGTWKPKLAHAIGTNLS